MQRLLMMAAPHFNATGPGGVQVQVRDTGHWAKFVGLCLGVMNDPRMSKNIQEIPYASREKF